MISPEDAADHLGIAVETLAKWRVSGDGPPFIKLSHRAVRYEQSALDAWLDARRRSSTSGV